MQRPWPLLHDQSHATQSETRTVMVMGMWQHKELMKNVASK